MNIQLWRWNWTTTGEKRPILERFKLVFEVIALIVGIFVGVCGAWCGYIAWQENRAANRLNVSNQLYAEDAKVYERLAQEPMLDAFWAEFPKDTNVVTVAHKQVWILVSTNDACIAHLCSTNSDPIPWTTIPEFVSKYIYGGEHFHTPLRDQLRKAYSFAEQILYEVDNAINARDQGFVKEEDFQTWAAYTDTLGKHPLFLTALAYAHDYGFLGESSCAFFKDRITSLEGATPLIQSIYPEMLTNEWATTNGLHKIGCRIKHVQGP